MRRSNAALFWPVLVLVVACDAFTKWLAESHLVPERVPHDLIAGADWLRATLIHNPGAAFGLHVGDYSRWVFTALTVIALVILGRLYTSTRPGDWARTLALALVCGGALGNLLDRLRSPVGVVDFIDLGMGESRWPTFNIADMAVSIGAFLLAWVLWDEDAEPETVSVPSSAQAAVVGDTHELS
jgi:signal peptidase II